MVSPLGSAWFSGTGILPHSTAFGTPSGQLYHSKDGTEPLAWTRKNGNASHSDKLAIPFNRMMQCCVQCMAL